MQAMEVEMQEGQEVMADKTETETKLRCSMEIPTAANIVGGMYLFIATIWVLTGVILNYFIFGMMGPNGGFSGIGEKHAWSSDGGLPDLAGTMGKFIFMGTHFFGGIYLTLGGVFQISPWSRQPERVHLHRLGGKIFTAMAVVAFVGGIGFLVQQGICAGGLSMTISFGIYGVLTLVFPVLAYQKAVAKDFESHREWAIRAFVFGIGSITYRIMLAFFAGIGMIDETYRGFKPEDPRLDIYYDQTGVRVTEWAFWIVPLLWTEWYLRAAPSQVSKSILTVSTIFMGVCCAFFLQGAAAR